MIQQSIQNPLASELLRGDYPEGATIEVDYDGDEFTFARRDAAADDDVIDAEFEVQR